MIQDVCLAGATGEVGRQLAARLVERPELRTRALVRRTGVLPAAANLTEVPFDFDRAGAYAEVLGSPCDLLLVALGTTRAVAGSDAAFLTVDRDYPLRLIEALAQAHPQARVGLVSSVGADRPRGLYLGAKAAVEAGLVASGLAHTIARPSLLLSQRVAFRPGEALMGRLLAPPMLALGRSLFPHSQAWWRWAPIQVREVAEALLEACLQVGDGQRRILEGRALHPGPVARWGRP